MINSTINLNPEICELIGAFIGDGYMGNYGKRKDKYLIGFAGDKKLDYDYYVNYLKPLIKRNYPFCNPRIYLRTDENTIMMRINSKELYTIFLNLGFSPGKKSRTIFIPDYIFYGSKKHLNSTLRGIFDTDGCIFFDKRQKYLKPYPRITYQTSSEKLFDQLEQYLSSYFSLYINKNKTKLRFTLEIYGHEQLRKFFKIIGFSNIRHKSKIMPQ